MSEISYKIATGSAHQINCYIGSDVARVIEVTPKEFTACFKGLFNALRHERDMEAYC